MAAAPGVDDRAALAGIIYQLHTGISWRLLPTDQLGCGSPVTCWRRLRDWQRAGSGVSSTTRSLTNSAAAAWLDWSRASLDSLSVRAKHGGADVQFRRPWQARQQVPPAHRPARHPGSGRPVGGQHHDSMLLEAMVDAVPPLKGPRGRPGRPRKRPARLHGDYPRCRRALRRRGITARIARRGIEPSDRLGRHRYLVERSLAWLVGYRRLQVRYERRSDLLLGVPPSGLRTELPQVPAPACREPVLWPRRTARAV
jgi:transposase